MNNVLMISGSQTLLRNRHLRQLIASNKEIGFRIDYVDAAHHGALAMALGGSMFFGGSTLAVVDNPHKGDLDLYRGHDNPSIIVLLNYEGDPKGNTKFGKFAKTLKKHKQYTALSEWKAPAAAVDFIIKEAKEVHNKTLTRGLAKAIVDRAGVDFGVLLFEIQKMAMLATVDGSGAIEIPHIKGGLASLMTASVGPLMAALRTRNKVHLAKALIRIKRHTSSDPTMMVCRLIGAEATRWMQAAVLMNMPPKVAASELGLNPWYFTEKILPPARRWGRGDLAGLIRAIAASERGLLDGHLSPWNGLMCHLLCVC